MFTPDAEDRLVHDLATRLPSHTVRGALRAAVGATNPEERLQVASVYHAGTDSYYEAVLVRKISAEEANGP